MTVILVMPKPLGPILCCALCLGGVSLAGALSLDELAHDSPFLTRDRDASAPAPTEGVSVEFRGVITTQDGTFFGLYDRTKQTGAWVRAEDSGGDFAVKNYDAANDQVTVEYQGQKLTLPLSASKVALSAASPTPMPVANIAPGGPGGPGGAPGQAVVVQPAASPEDARRLETVAAEVRRRRALRQAASQQASQPAAQPAGGGGR